MRHIDRVGIPASQKTYGGSEGEWRMAGHVLVRCSIGENKKTPKRCEKWLTRQYVCDRVVEMAVWYIQYYVALIRRKTKMQVLALLPNFRFPSKRNNKEQAWNLA